VEIGTTLTTDFDPIGNPSGSGDQETARKSDRDWHVIIEDSGLAEQFEAYLKHDFEVALPEQIRGQATEPPELELERGPAKGTLFSIHRL
jgi:hypothetical protein